ncbi:arylesterase [Robiginitalea sp. SC105]|uniref:arylesterase n=1 Tax=Robiginitalea sp. SC105 TaxID=2762332 RepID=UPI001639909A|nr:arylesterase [Robiginitalea sp. SC105]MBC2839990.1 arylesterase [Robiginitalea sp. SC105]
MAGLLKFRYILLVFLLLGCGGEQGKKQGPEGNSPSGNVEETTVAGTGNTILFFGDSLTAGLGLEPEQAFPALIGERMDSLGYPFKVVNAGLSGETTASGVNRLDWVLRQPVSVFVLELGANDGLRGIPLEETRKNLATIVERVRQKDSTTRIILTGMQLPPNMGPDYTSEFRNIFPELAEQYNLKLVPFLLAGVGGIPELNQQDGIHPTAEGHQILADNVWEVLQPVLEAKEPAAP